MLKPGEDPGGERRVRLGRLADLGGRVMSGRSVGELIATEHPDVAVLVKDGRPILAVWRWCPHEGRDLVRFGHLSSDEQTWTCVHKSYCWAQAGAVLRVGARGSAGPMVVRPVDVDSDGVVWSVLPAALMQEAV